MANDKDKDKEINRLNAELHSEGKRLAKRANDEKAKYKAENIKHQKAANGNAKGNELADAILVACKRPLSQARKECKRLAEKHKTDNI